MKDFIKGALFGAVVTGVAVALTTPKSGEELREDIYDLSTDAYHKGMNKANHLKEEAITRRDEFRERASQIYDEGRQDLDEQLNELRNRHLEK